MSKNDRKYNYKKIEKIEKKRIEPDFRIAAKNLFLTYSNTILTKMEVLDALQKKLSVNKYIISQEDHPNNKTNNINDTDIIQQTSEKTKKHIHVYLNLAKKVNIVSLSFLDIVDSTGKIIHGSYEAAKTNKPLIDYIKKDGDYITNIENIETENLSFGQQILQVAKEKGKEAAMEFYVKEKPGEVYKKYKAVEANVEAFLASIFVPITAKYSTEEFEYPPELMDWWLKERHTKTLLLVGPKGCGKTQGILSLVAALNPLIIGEKNSLKNLKDKHEVIMFNDFKWKDLTREEIIQLVDKDISAEIRILYKMMPIRAKVIRIIIANDTTELLSKSVDPHGAIRRRVKLVRLKKTMIKKKTLASG